MVVPALTYRSEKWALTRSRDKDRKTEMKFLRNVVEYIR
jgi:hypothetical protein